MPSSGLLPPSAGVSSISIPGITDFSYRVLTSVSSHVVLEGRKGEAILTSSDSVVENKVPAGVAERCVRTSPINTQGPAETTFGIFFSSMNIDGIDLIKQLPLPYGG